MRLKNGGEVELLINLCFKKIKRMLNKLVSNEDAVKVEANQSRQGDFTAQGRQGTRTELMDTKDAVTARSSGFWETGRVNIIKLYTDWGLEDTGTLLTRMDRDEAWKQSLFLFNPRVRLETSPIQCPPQPIHRQPLSHPCSPAPFDGLQVDLIYCHLLPGKL